MRYITFALAAILLVGCVSASEELTAGQKESIPYEASVVTIKSDVTPDLLYNKIYQELGMRGWGFQSSDPQRSITTTAKPVGQETTLKVQVYIHQEEGDTIAKLRGAWGVTSSMAAGISAGTGASFSGGATNKAKWTMGRPKRAFSMLVDIAHSAAVGNVSYDKEGN